MEQVNQNIRCTDCGMILPLEWVPVCSQQCCPGCGSPNQTINIDINDPIKIEVHACMDAKEKDILLPSSKNPRKHIFSGDDVRKIDGKWMEKERVIDKDKNYYKEIVTDPSNREIIHFNEEPLSEHQGHGSAKKKKPDAP